MDDRPWLVVFPVHANVNWKEKLSDRGAAIWMLIGMRNMGDTAKMASTKIRDLQVLEQLHRIGNAVNEILDAHNVVGSGHVGLRLGKNVTFEPSVG